MHQVATLVLVDRQATDPCAVNAYLPSPNESPVKLIEGIDPVEHLLSGYSLVEERLVHEDARARNSW